MTREIKFRAWSFITNSMSPGVSIQQWCYEPYDVELRALDYPKIIFLQFTGIKDRNGKDIYEGDIVKLEQWEPSIYQVGFDRGAFCFWGSNETEGAYYNDAKYLEKCKIIGNIYENPELLK